MDATTGSGAGGNGTEANPFASLFQQGGAAGAAQPATGAADRSAPVTQVISHTSPCRPDVVPGHAYTQVKQKLGVSPAGMRYN